MTEGQEHAWHIELDDMRARVQFALNNIDSLSKRIDTLRRLTTTYTGE